MRPPPPVPPPDPQARSAFFAGIAAFGTWGIVPIYWKQLARIPAAELLAHRFLWTTLFAILLLAWQRRWPEISAAVRVPRTMRFCAGSGAAIAINWFIFIWAVNAGRVVETSMGYFMTPLVNVLFGAIFLRERLTRMQFASVVLAALGVLNLTFGYGRFPWIALSLCASFGTYGLLRKVSGVQPIPGLFIETVLIAPFALGYLGVLGSRGGLVFHFADWKLSLLVASTGLVTGLPLLWFAHAARHLRLTTVGFLQYLAPIGAFSLGVFLYHESFTRQHLVTFGLIWAALVLFSWEAWTRWRKVQATAGGEGLTPRGYAGARGGVTRL